MAHSSGYRYDVFLSYSHANNTEDWVTRFEEKLTARLRERLSNDVAVFRDKLRLHGNEELTPSLREAVTSAAVFVPIISRNYLTRPYCLLECQAFLAANAGRKGCIFPVRYDDVSPAEFQRVLGGELFGYEFFGPAGSGPALSEFDTGSTEFKYALLALRDDIGRRIEQFTQPVAPPVTVADSGSSTPSNSPPAVESSDSSPPPAERPTVLLAEPPPALAKQRDELANFLRNGFHIEVVLPGAGFHEADDFEPRFAASVQQADLFVQLLGRSFVAHPDEDLQSWDRWQHQQAESAGKPSLRWFSKFDSKGGAISLEKLDATHRDFVTLAGTWDCDFEKFKQLVCEEAQRLCLERRQQQLLTSNTAGESKPLVVIRTDRSDREFADQLGGTLARLQCDWTRVGDKEVESLEQFAAEFAANGLLVVYRSCPGKWVLKRLQELRGFLRSHHGRRWACGLWKEPLDDDDPLSCSLDGLVVIDPRNSTTLEQFVGAMRQLGRAEVMS